MRYQTLFSSLKLLSKILLFAFQVTTVHATPHMALITINLPSPAELRGGWAARAAVQESYSPDGFVSAAEDGWLYSDGGGNWVYLRIVGNDKALLLGHDHEFSQTALTEANAVNSILLADAPSWWLENAFPHPLGEDVIGFIYGWENNQWQRSNYRENDGFEYVGLLAAISASGRHSISETVKDMYGSAKLSAVKNLISADANISEAHLKKITDKNIAAGIAAARNFLKAPLTMNNNTQQDFTSIQRFITGIEANDIMMIEDFRDEITADDVPGLIAYYHTLSDWDHKTGCIELLSDQSDKALEEVMLDFLRVPKNMPEEDRIEIAQATALNFLEGSDNFMEYYRDRVLLEQKVSEMLKKHNLTKAKS